MSSDESSKEGSNKWDEERLKRAKDEHLAGTNRPVLVTTFNNNDKSPQFNTLDNNGDHFLSNRDDPNDDSIIGIGNPITHKGILVKVDEEKDGEVNVFSTDLDPKLKYTQYDEKGEVVKKQGESGLPNFTNGGNLYFGEHGDIKNVEICAPDNASNKLVKKKDSAIKNIEAEGAKMDANLDAVIEKAKAEKVKLRGSIDEAKDKVKKATERNAIENIVNELVKQNVREDEQKRKHAEANTSVNFNNTDAQRTASSPNHVIKRRVEPRPTNAAGYGGGRGAYAAGSRGAGTTGGRGTAAGRSNGHNSRGSNYNNSYNDRGSNHNNTYRREGGNANFLEAYCGEGIITHMEVKTYDNGDISEESFAFVRFDRNGNEAFIRAGLLMQRYGEIYQKFCANKRFARVRVNRVKPGYDGKKPVVEQVDLL